MTPHQVLAVAAIGGLAAILGLIVFVALVLGVHRLVQRLVDAHDELRERRERRRALADYRRQLDALPTASHPKDA